VKSGLVTKVMDSDFMDGQWPFIKWVLLWFTWPILCAPFAIINWTGVAVFEGIVEGFWRLILFQ
jgi:hypothetical protein